MKINTFNIILTSIYQSVS